MARKQTRRFELTSGSSRRFWEIILDGSQHTVRYGRIDSEGQSKTKSFDTTRTAALDAEKLIGAKLKKGYVELASRKKKAGAAVPSSRRRPVTPRAPSVRPFGRLTRDDHYWIASKKVSLFGTEVPVDIDAGDDGPDGGQGEAFADFLERRKVLRPIVARAIYDYYQEVCEDYRKAFDGEEVDERAPRVSDPSEIWPLVELTGIFIPSSGKKGSPDVCLHWSCSWEEEHGLEVAFKADMVQHVGWIRSY